MSAEDVQRWRDALMRAAEHDLATRTELAQSGALFDGYHPAMEAVHLKNAALLAEVFDAVGWPGRSLFSEDGAGAAFLILQHSISRPDLQRRGLQLLLDAVPRGDANALDAACLADRIAVFEGRPQLFGTQFDWFDGELSPAPLVAPEEIDARRASVGLAPLAETVTQMRATARVEGETAPADLAARRAGFDSWARRVGWR